MEIICFRYFQTAFLAECLIINVEDGWF